MFSLGSSVGFLFIRLVLVLSLFAAVILHVGLLSLDLVFLLYIFGSDILQCFIYFCSDFCVNPRERRAGFCVSPVISM